MYRSDIVLSFLCLQAEAIKRKVELFAYFPCDI